MADGDKIVWRAVRREDPAADTPGPTADTPPPAPPVDPRLYDRPDVREVLAKRDVAGLIRAVNQAGVPQRRIAELVEMAQSEVSEILAGRRVLAYDVLVRVADGLQVPRGWMGLAYCHGGCGVGGEDGAYGEEVTNVSPEEVIEMFRRHIIALAPIAALAHSPLTKLAELLEHSELPDPSPVPLPSRLSWVHVARVVDLTRRLDEARRTYGDDPETSSVAAAQASRLLTVPGTDDVETAMMKAVSQLHLHAGWAGYGGDLYDRAMYHYAHALELSIKAGDPYFQTLALSWSGKATIEHGDSNEGLKLLQLGLTTVPGVSSELDPTIVVIGGKNSRTALRACMLADSATAYSRLDYPNTERETDRHLAEAWDLWTPTPDNTFGDLDRPAADIALDQGQLDKAASHAVASMHRWKSSTNKLGIANSASVLATIYVRAGEPKGLQLAHSSIDAASRVTSVRTRNRLKPLVKALAARRGSDYRDLARRAYHVCMTRV